MATHVLLRRGGAPTDQCRSLDVYVAIHGVDRERSALYPDPVRRGVALRLGQPMECEHGAHVTTGQVRRAAAGRVEDAGSDRIKDWP
jgi:hypothetical protein